MGQIPDNSYGREAAVPSKASTKEDPLSLTLPYITEEGTETEGLPKEKAHSTAGG